MAIKKSTAKTKTTPATSKTAFPAIAAIQDIARCIEKDNAALAKSYPKALADIEKDIKRANKSMEQLKKHSKKKGKTTAARAVKGDTSVEMNKTLSALKDDKAVLLEGYKQFLALQKNTAQFEKQWAKKLKQRATPKKKSKKGSSVKKQPTVVPAVQDESEA